MIANRTKVHNQNGTTKESPGCFSERQSPIMKLSGNWHPSWCRVLAPSSMCKDPDGSFQKSGALHVDSNSRGLIITTPTKRTLNDGKNQMERREK